MTTTRERMTKERLDTTVLAMLRDDVTMRGPFDQTVREVVPLEAALAYGADEREAGIAEGIRRSRVLVICAPCKSGTHYHTEAQVGHLICDCGCWWPLKQRVLYSGGSEDN